MLRNALPVILSLVFLTWVGSAGAFNPAVLGVAAPRGAAAEGVRLQIPAEHRT